MSMSLSPFLARFVDAHRKAALLHDEKSTATPMFLLAISLSQLITSNSSQQATDFQTSVPDN